MAGMSVIMDASQVRGGMSKLEQLLTGASIAGFLSTAGVQILQQSHSERFASEGDGAVGMWAALKPATVERREAYGFPGEHPINVRTGELERYVTGSPGTVLVGASSGTLTYPGRSGLTQTVRKKLTTAQQGASSPPTVARPVVELGAQDAASVLAALQGWMEVAMGSPIGVVSV